ncbi:MAG TPA: hypothetical protein VK760_06740 [Candidatus Acidoferrales bacterium]|jgi:hypothetical protein|nr:hypothetical protein [Candidatus Acidoferrales bacterium]
MRRIGFAVFAFALAIAGCGRQVTPNLPGLGPGGLNAGYMSVKFDVAAPMNFTADSYVIAFNTTGASPVPNTNVISNGYAGYSYEIVVSGNAGGAYANAYEFYRTPGMGPNSLPSRQPIYPTGRQLQLAVNSNGLGTEFTVTFARVIFSGIQPTGNATPPPVAGTWAFNAFTGQPDVTATWTYVDSMGAGGPNDPQWESIPPLDVTQPFDTYYAGLYQTPLTDQSAQIVSVEIANSP